MRLYLNEQLVRRNSFWGKVFVWGGLGLAIGSVVISFQSPQVLNPYVLAGFLGVFAAQAGTMLTNRWGRNPRMDEVMSEALKGLDDRFALFHYLLRVDHALITPNGAFVLLPRTEDGVIEYQEGKWLQRRQKRGFLRRGGTRDIPGLERQARSRAVKLKRWLRRYLPEEAQPDVQSVIVFIHSEANVRVEDSPHPAVHVKKLKSWLRRLPKAKGLTGAQIDEIAGTVGF
jgi:hypothetical protein